MQDIHPDGLKQITMCRFDRIDELNRDLIDQLIDASPNLAKLTINRIIASSSNDEILTYMIEKFLQLPNSPLTHINLINTFSHLDGDKILNALSFAKLPNLISLNLGYNLFKYQGAKPIRVYLTPLIQILQK